MSQIEPRSSITEDRDTPYPWPGKVAAAILGIADTKVGQWFHPCQEKLVKLAAARPHETAAWFMSILAAAARSNAPARPAGRVKPSAIS